MMAAVLDKVPLTSRRSMRIDRLCGDVAFVGLRYAKIAAFRVTGGALTIYGTRQRVIWRFVKIIVIHAGNVLDPP